MADEEWEAHKAEIERLYIRENKKLEEVLQFMETTYGFRKTKYHYTARLKKGGFKKYRMGALKWRHVNREIQKRAAEGQNLEVWFDGVYYDPKTVQFEIHRQGFQRETDKYRQEPLSPTPEGLIVCSPGPLIFQVTWPQNLPWFIFSNTALSSLQNVPSNPSISLEHLPGVRKMDLPSQIIERGLIDSLGSLMIGSHAKVLRTGRNSARVAAALSSIMPEQHEGQNLYIAERLCGLRGGSDAVERLQVALFLLSNSFQVSEPDDDSWQSNIREFLDVYSDDETDDDPDYETNAYFHDKKRGEPRTSKEDQTIMATFYQSGLDTVNNLKYLLFLPGATAHAISHKLFASAVRSEDVRMVRMALEAGMSPDIPIIHDGFPVPPLILASNFRDSRAALDMCKLFLSYGSGLKDTRILERALCEAIRSRNNELIKLFLARNIPIPGEALSAAIKTGTPGLFSMLLDIDPNINKRSGGSYDLSILGLAVDRNDVSMTQYLLALGADVDAIQHVKFRENYLVKSTTLGLAIRKGNEDIINLLLDTHPNINHQEASDDYIPPLVLSVECGAINITQRLLSVGAEVSTVDGIEEMSLVQRALERNDLETSRLLISYGASVEPTQMEDYYTSILYENVAMNNIDTAISLLSWGARKNETFYDKVPDTILGAAIVGGHCEMVGSLLQAGATKIGKSLIQIGNLETAMYLEQLGLLPQILHCYGQPILVSAIRMSRRSDDGLVQYLLDRNVDKQPKNVGLKPFFMMSKCSLQPVGRERYWRFLDYATVCLSPLAAAISYLRFPESFSLAKLLIVRGASIGDLELTAAVEDYRCGSQHFGILQLLLDNLSQQPCAVPNAFEKALQYDHIVFLVRRFLEIGLDPGGKVVASGFLDNIFLYQLHGVIDCEVLDSILERAVIWRNGVSLRTVLHSRTWTAVEKGRALTTALHYRHKSAVQDLLDAGADVNQAVRIDLGSYPPLWLAIERQDISLTRRLVALGADCEWNISRNNPGREKTIFCAAVNTGNRHIVKILLDVCTYVNRPAASERGRMALQAAAEDGNVQIVDMLLDAGADPNQSAAEFGGGTALQFAAIKGYIGIARKLLAEGADVNAKKSLRDGRTALEGAAEHGRIDMLQLLLNEGASIVASGRRQYIRAVKLAEQNAEFGTAKLLRDQGGWTE
ncbi:ankyrin [Aspergillus neoniger CBS 115656]|uniref:Ankyrin n=1 Tax=Aspergillus neoniger (strain CBS 115656) TaxID=1448310 RepID=A0A318YCX8_ASPNB|nr:ankyrin [Aspergillus neoniger CBS 115656]PYH31437.1 ankyrin [Aspergillus neoniger CBS 115656]